MSSAALQNTPTSLTSLNTPPLASASSSSTRPFSSSHPPPSREAYHAQPQSSGPSIPSSQRPSPSQAGNGTTFNTSQPANDYHPMSSRTAALSSPARPSADHQTSSPSRRKNMAAAVPPRTSSNHHTSTATSSSRRAAHANDRGSTNSPRRAQHDSNGNPDAEQASASRSRRTAQYHSSQDPQQRSGGSRDARPGGSSSMPVRSHPGSSSQSTSKGPSREASEILNSVLISQPEVDIQREKERLALAQPHHVPDSLDGDATPAPIGTQSGHPDEIRRGGRSRHDHSKREKHTKFGEYILGNTIGEGEFGKVKLGWKQEGGVQVCLNLSFFSKFSPPPPQKA